MSALYETLCGENHLILNHSPIFQSDTLHTIFLDTYICTTVSNNIEHPLFPNRENRIVASAGTAASFPPENKKERLANSLSRDKGNFQFSPSFRPGFFLYRTSWPLCVRLYDLFPRIIYRVCVLCAFHVCVCVLAG